MANPIERAIARAEARLATAYRGSPELAILRSTAPESPQRPETGATDPVASTGDLTADPVGNVLGRQSADGSWGGDLVATAEALLHLAELSAEAETTDAEVRPAAEKAVAWLRSRKGKPGRFADHCSPEWHRAGLCHHFVGGFFSPGQEPPSELRLWCGATIPDGPEARLAASSMALRAVVRWGSRGTDIMLHLDGLARVLGSPPRWSDPLIGPPGRLAAAAALIEAGRPGDRQVVDTYLDNLAGVQRADGSWPDADLFHVLEVLDTASRHGALNDAGAAASARAAHALALLQRENGSWGSDTHPRQLLIAIRAMRRALADST